MPSHYKWKDYTASRAGVIGGIRVKTINPLLHSTGYYVFTVRSPGVQKQLRVHRFVWECFHGPVAKGEVVNHKNGNMKDNRLANLEVMSIKDNTKHAAKMGKLGRKKG